MPAQVRRSPPRAIAPAQAQAYRLRCQRLDQRTLEPLDELCAAVGFPQVPGGASPYLALHARAPRHERRVFDRAVFEEEALFELPFARQSTVLAPASDAPFVLAAARPGHDERARPLLERGLVDSKKRARLAESILAALDGGPVAADELRARLPEALCVPFGELGRKAGFPSLFTLVLRELQLAGLVVRVRRERRLDRDGFAFVRPRRPLEACPDRALALARLAARYFRAYAPAPASAFAFWADAATSEARLAVQAAGLATVPVVGQKEPGHLGAEQLDELASFAAPVPGRLALVPFRDPVVSFARDLKPLLPDPHREVKLADWRGRFVPAGGGSAVHQHFLLHGGFVAGVWEFDRDSRKVRFATFEPLATRVRRAAEELAQDLAGWIANELGAARFYGDEREELGRLDDAVAAWGATSPRPR